MQEDAIVSTDQSRLRITYQPPTLVSPWSIKVEDHLFAIDVGKSLNEVHCDIRPHWLWDWQMLQMLRLGVHMWSTPSRSPSSGIGHVEVLAQSYTMASTWLSTTPKRSFLAPMAPILAKTITKMEKIMRDYDPSIKPRDKHKWAEASLAHIVDLMPPPHPVIRWRDNLGV